MSPATGSGLPLHVLRTRVLLAPRDFEASLRFYEQQLGLHRAREFGRAPYRGVVFHLGTCELELSEAAGPGVPVAGVRLWLQVADLHATVAAVDEAGIAVTEPPELKPWGLHEATVTDPDGLPLVLIEVPADHPLRRDTRG
jgi:catechol 2,3-dioxygenase-like lactoylglutathione lyase family enzyme